MSVLNRVPVREQDPKVRATNFDEVCLGYNMEEAMEEASRCINCKNAKCIQGCPVSINIPAFVKAVKEGKITEAADIIAESSALPAICGRVCPQETQCEGKCIRGIKGCLLYTSKTPVLCFVDEVLRGTNTVERIAASSRILQSFAENGVMCFAATHDIELTHMLEHLYSNYHFKEDVKDNDVIFNYRLYEGRAVSRNAIKLLGVLGYDENVITKADETAKRFLDTGVWSLE